MIGPQVDSPGEGAFPCLDQHCVFAYDEFRSWPRCYLTRVDEIAQAADVNKALIYYYFESKEDILDHLIQTLFDDINRISVDFIQDHVVEMIRDGRLDIEPDRFHFVDDEAIASFLRSASPFYEKMVDYMLSRRSAIRILMMESLKRSKHHNDLFALLRLWEKSDENSIYKAISSADKDYDYSDAFVLLKFFFGIIPIVNFAAYFDDYRELSSFDDQQLKASFVRSLKLIGSGFVSGTDILLGDDMRLPGE